MEASSAYLERLLRVNSAVPAYPLRIKVETVVTLRRKIGSSAGIPVPWSPAGKRHPHSIASHSKKPFLAAAQTPLQLNVMTLMTLF